MASTLQRLTLRLSTSPRALIKPSRHGHTTNPPTWLMKYSTEAHGSNSSEKCLTEANVNRCVREMEYAVRGAVPLEALRISSLLNEEGHGYPFNSIVSANIGDCHAMGQKPLTFTRQLIACCIEPSLLTSNVYPTDVIERAKYILSDVGGNSLGSYTDSRGITVIRKHVQDMITARDRIQANYETIYLTNGATDGIKAAITLCLTDIEKTGVMIPTPQYPLYSAAITELDAYPINYYLDEDNGWSIDMSELQHSLDEATPNCRPKVMVVINPGNPTGQYLLEENMREIIKFCHKNKLLLLADEVYQENIHVEGGKFSSFRKVLLEMGPSYSNMQLVSFNSISKGYFGECGLRGGYMEMIGFDSALLHHVYKFFSVRLCANTAGQVALDAMVKPPQRGDPSYELFNEERQTVLESLKTRANMVYERFNSIKGVTCNKVQGAMYAFPKVDIPQEAWKDAQAEDPNMLLDTYYCLQFLRQYGVCFVPGSGFGQKEGTWHFRTTILPSIKLLDKVLSDYEQFHHNFVTKYSNSRASR